MILTTGACLACVMILQESTNPAALYYECQQPGSPLWLQHFLKLTSLQVLFLISRGSFLVRLIGSERLETISFTFGFSFFLNTKTYLYMIKE